MNFNSIFSYDNPMTRFLAKLGKLLWLNILWLITSLPLFTLGASTCALYYTTLRLVRDEEGYLTREYFPERILQSLFFLFFHCLCIRGLLYGLFLFWKK